MCGFTAIVGSNHNLSASLKRISYRGLVGNDSYHSEGFVHIAHTRLPIVNLEAKQPAEYNSHIGFLVGEIFNFKEIYPNAETDTLAITRSYFDKGLSSFHEFDGFWTFITIDRGELVVVNDYLSQKPVYYRTDILAIASEPDALLEYGPVDWDETFASNIRKWGYDPTGRTAWKQIRQLPPGCFWKNGVIQEYWDWDAVKNMDLRQGLFKATANRLLGDRPVACLLSGGLDSSLVFKICKDLGQEITSFHVENSEEQFAKLVDPETKPLKLDGLSYDQSLIQHQSPVDLGSVHPQAILGQAVKAAGYHVVLTGDGADELFGGYDRASKYDSQASDVFSELPYYHLPRLDRLMMRNTVELRTPFLAPWIVKAALALPYSSRIGKSILRKTFGDLLPKEILERPKLPLRILRAKNGGVNFINSNIGTFRREYDRKNSSF